VVSESPINSELGLHAPYYHRLTHQCWY